MLPPPRVLKPLPVNTEMVCRPRAVVILLGSSFSVKSPNVGNIFGWQSLVLFLVSLVMVLLFHADDYRAGENIERMINRLGRAFSGQ